MTYLLLSYPRSGNTWIRYFIEHVSERPTIGYKENYKNFDSPLLCKKYHDPIAIKRHGLIKDPVEHDGLILVLRNPKECLLRHTGCVGEAVRHLQDRKKRKIEFNVE